MTFFLRPSLYIKIGLLFILLCYNADTVVAQVNYNSAGSYGIRKTVPAYTGSAVKVRRTCDDVTQDIGFTSCGQLDTIALKRFAVASNPLSAITSGATAAYSLRKLSCTYSGNAITVRRTCDNATQDIGFTANGDLDTMALKKFVLASNPLSALSIASAAAYSLRKLRCAYAGNAIEVRRSSDNTTLAIGFTTNGDLDTTALKTFVGTGASDNGFVSIWYDQSGNGRNAIQATAGNQPRIITAGIVLRQNGMPAIKFSGSPILLTATALTAANSTSGGGNITTSSIVFQSQNTVAGTLFSNGDSGPNRYNIHAPWSDNKTYLDLGNNGGGGRVSTNLTWPNLSIGSFRRSGAQGDIWKDGVNVLTTSGMATSVTSTLAMNIGGSAAYGSYMIGSVSELIAFPSALSTTDRLFLEWTQGQYYNISGVTMINAPSVAASAFVTKWYDQSGNSKDVTQTAAANQPRIINAGVIERQNGMPAIRFIAASVTTFSANTPMITDKMSISIVAKLNNAAVRGTLFDIGAVGGSSWSDFVMEANTHQTSGSKWGFYANNSSFDAAAATSTNLTSLSLVANNTYTSSANITTNTSYYVNGTAAALTIKSGTNFYRTSWPNGFVIGNFNGYSIPFDGFMTELIVLPTALSNTDRQFLEWTQGQYYNISGISLSAMPAGSANAYVTTWYDQSGNGRNLTQPTAGNQPKIISSGKLSLQNGRPTIPLDGTSNWLIESTLSISNPYSLNTIATRTINGGGAGGYQRLINISSTGDGYGYQGVFSGDYATFNGNGAGTWNDIAACTPLTAIPLHTTSIMTMVSATGATGLKPSVNGTPLDLKDGTTTSATGFLVGGAFSTNGTSQLWPGTISEFNIFSSALSTTRINLLETNQAAYYAKTISNNKYTPPTSTSYNLFVNGIGRESATDSVGGTRSTTGMGISVTTAAAAFLKDNGDYLTYGMNCFFTPNTSLLNLPATVVQRWENDWYINKTDVGSNNGIMSIYFDFSDYGVSLTPGVASNYVLLYRSSSAGAFSIVPATTVTTAGDQVRFAVDAANVLTNSYYTIGTKDAVVSPLPIELLGFNCAILNSNSVNLTWSTASEFNSAYFLVEKSSDAVNYESIGNITASGNSNATKHYSLVDENTLGGVSYYRLKSVDLDGSYKYSPLCSVTNQSDNLNEDIRIYPNPTNSFITIDVTHSVYAQPDFYFLMDVTGKKIDAPSVRNNNIISLDMSLLQPGLYMLEIIKGNQKSVKKITLQK